MKTKLFTFALLWVSTAVFAQGKISMVNDLTRLVYFADYPGSTEPADAAYQGKKVPAVLPSGITLMVDLYGGTSPGSMTLQTSTTINPQFPPGWFGPLNFVSPNMAGGVVGFWQIQVREAAFANETASGTAGGYVGHSAIFEGKSGSSLAFNSIISPLANNFASTWAAGTFDLGGGEFGAIPIGFLEPIPEPSGLAILGVGVACFQFFRRRK